MTLNSVSLLQDGQTIGNWLKLNTCRKYIESSQVLIMILSIISILIFIIFHCIYHVAYIKKGFKYNIITLDWSKIGKIKDYRTPAIKTDAVGFTVAQFLDQLVKYTNVKPEDMHLIGHSLGAHIVGAAGSHLNSGKVGRITGEK